MAHHSEEQKSLEEFFQTKGLKTRNEMLDDVSSLPSLHLLGSLPY